LTLLQNHFACLRRPPCLGGLRPQGIAYVDASPLRLLSLEPILVASRRWPHHTPAAAGKACMTPKTTPAAVKTAPLAATYGCAPGVKLVDGTSPINTSSAPGTATTAPTTSGILTHVQERRCTPTSKAPIIEGSSAQRTGTWNEVTTSTLADKSRS
jgi:hypothetical protein